MKSSPNPVPWLFPIPHPARHHRQHLIWSSHRRWWTLPKHRQAVPHHPTHNPASTTCQRRALAPCPDADSATSRAAPPMPPLRPWATFFPTENHCWGYPKADRQRWLGVSNLDNHDRHCQLPLPPLSATIPITIALSITVVMSSSENRYLPTAPTTLQEKSLENCQKPARK